MNRLDSYSPLGYSVAGVVLEVGRGAEEFSVGQLVACAGNEHALHAEINWVPTNLCVAVPDGVSPQLAAFATVGSIATAGCSPGERADRRHCLRDRPWTGRSVGRPAAGGLGGEGGRTRPRRGSVPPGGESWRPACAPHPPTREWTQLRDPGPGLGRPGRRSDLPRLGWLLQPARRVGCAARTRPGDGGRHRQVQAGPALERLLREGARPPILTLIWARPLRPELRGRRDRLSRRLRALDRAPQPPLLRTGTGHEGDRPQPLIAGIYPLMDAPNVYEQLSEGRFKAWASSSSTTFPKRARPRRVDPGRTMPAPARTRRTSSHSPAISRAPGTAGIADRLHRRRELRLVDAASASGQATRGGAGTSRHAPIAVGRQRAA